MPALEHFITRRLKKTQIDEFFAVELQRAGYSGVDIQKTPLGTRVIIYAARPGMVIGRRGRNVKILTQLLEERYDIENPQIEVSEIEAPELNAKVMAQRLTGRLERGTHYRRATYSILRRVKAAGAKGVEIKVSGKLSGHRSRYKKFRDGFVAKCGEPANQWVDKAVSYAVLKKGVIGVSVKIMRPTGLLPNEIEIIDIPPNEKGENETEEESGAS
ncbi:MAG: 30S ribosomal protein S3 [Candidatus Helarchaeota archaeon]|nr:30S ribosomal protein S3 [Candidatus Helarchaeota archaeon]